jgi:hypothetical protein
MTLTYHIEHAGKVYQIWDSQGKCHSSWPTRAEAEAKLYELLMATKRVQTDG